MTRHNLSHSTYSHENVEVGSRSELFLSDSNGVVTPDGRLRNFNHFGVDFNHF